MFWRAHLNPSSLTSVWRLPGPTWLASYHVLKDRKHAQLKQALQKCTQTLTHTHTHKQHDKKNEGSLGRTNILTFAPQHVHLPNYRAPSSETEGYHTHKMIIELVQWTQGQASVVVCTRWTQCMDVKTISHHVCNLNSTLFWHLCPTPLPCIMLLRQQPSNSCFWCWCHTWFGYTGKHLSELRWRGRWRVSVIDIWVYPRIQTQLYVHTYKHKHAHLLESQIHRHTYTQTHIYIYIYMRMRTFSHIHTHIPCTHTRRAYPLSHIRTHTHKVSYLLSYLVS